MIIKYNLYYTYYYNKNVLFNLYSHCKISKWNSLGLKILTIFFRIVSVFLIVTIETFKILFEIGSWYELPFRVRKLNAFVKTHYRSFYLPRYTDSVFRVRRIPSYTAIACTHNFSASLASNTIACTMRTRRDATEISKHTHARAGTRQSPSIDGWKKVIAVGKSAVGSRDQSGEF